MKKALSLVLAVIMIAMMFLLSGCVRYHGTMKFNADGTLDTTLLIAMYNESTVDPTTGETYYSLFDEETLKTYEELGFTLEKYSEDGFEGYILHLTEDIGKELEGLSGAAAMASIGETPIFYVEKDKVIMRVPVPEYSEEEVEAGREMFESVGGYDMITVEFPFAPLESNATSVSEDGKALTWDLFKNCGSIYAIYSLEDFTKAGMTTDYMSVNPFEDVEYEDYCHDAVMWALDNGITTGTSETRFSPDSTCTRGQVVTFLWRALGEPEPNIMFNPFTDVKETDYYYKAVLWAVENGITAGTSETTFSPASTCTNGHILTFIWRAYGKPGYTGEGEWYSDAIEWAENNGLLDGLPTEELDPMAYCPRSDVVTVLYSSLSYTVNDLFSNFTDLFSGIYGLDDAYGDYGDYVDFKDYGDIEY